MTVTIDVVTPIWAALWDARGAGVHLAALDAALAAENTITEMGDWLT